MTTNQTCTVEQNDLDALLSAAKALIGHWNLTGGVIIDSPEDKAVMRRFRDAIANCKTAKNTPRASIEHPLTIADVMEEPQAALRQLLDDARRLAFTKLAVKGAVDQWISTNGDAFDSPENTAAMRELRDAISKMQETAQ